MNHPITPSDVEAIAAQWAAALVYVAGLAITVYAAILAAWRSKDAQATAALAAAQAQANSDRLDRHGATLNTLLLNTPAPAIAAPAASPIGDTPSPAAPAFDPNKTILPGSTIRADAPPPVDDPTQGGGDAATEDIEADADAHTPAVEDAHAHPA